MQLLPLFKRPLNLACAAQAWRGLVILFLVAMLYAPMSQLQAALEGRSFGADALQHQMAGLGVPLEENSGQFAPGVAFMGRTFAGPVWITETGALLYQLPAPGDRALSGAQAVSTETASVSPWLLTERWVDALPMTPSGNHRGGTTVSRFGEDGHFQSRTWQSVTLGEAWPGIELELAVRGNNIEKLFHVAPGADPAQIVVEVGGTTGLSVGPDGALIVATGNGELRYTPPVAWQDIGAQRVAVAVRYAIPEGATVGASGALQYRFELAGHDPRYPLVIDPLIQSSYFGVSQ